MVGDRDAMAEAVKRDVRDEYVSIEGARRDYGVCIVGDPANDPEGLRIDHEQTARLRRGIQASHAAQWRQALRRPDGGYRW